jgi:hypothetical protein
MNLYTFVIPFSGTMSVWTEAETEEEARAVILKGNWVDSNEETFTSHPEKSMTLIEVEPLNEEELYE